MHTPLYRKANYLVVSNTGIYTFRWNLRADNKHYQPKVSLKTRKYLEAMRQASVLAIQISSLHNPTIEDVRAIYSDFSSKQKKSGTLLKEIDITSYLSDLSVKSQAELGWRCL